MVASITKLFIISIIYFIMKCTTLIHGQPQVPCIFFLGDSLFDNGNNNFLITRAKVNYFPYGIDYPGGIATGRFSNGKNIPDFLVEFLGFDESVPPFAIANGVEILKGVNYGSGGAGILDETGKLQCGRISMNMQLFNHEMTISKIALLLGNATLAKEHLNKCLYVVDMGNNDYINNYLLTQYYLTSTMYTPEKFAAILTKQYSQQLRTLYNYGARKVAVFGVGLIGCLPQLLSTNPTNGSSCIDSFNNMAQQFNNRLKPLIDNLNSNLPDAQFIFINSTSIASVDPSTLGIRVTNAPCCVVSKTGLCDVGKEPCNNRNEFYFWDNYHPSEIADRATAARAYNAALPSDAYPIDIRRLVQQ